MIGRRRLAQLAIFVGVLGAFIVPLELGLAQRATTNAPASGECRSCHAEITREWAGSMHRQSFRDPLFQAGYRVDHRAFCRDCHAPRNDGRDPAPGSLAHDEGVGCADCHRPRRTHPSREPALDWTARDCGECHQFRFPREHRGFDASEHMQRTIDEHAQSGRTESCIDCHMRERGHGFTVRSDDIAAAIAIEGELVARSDGTELVVRLTNIGAGHAIPTGDVLRALELRVWPVDSPNAAQVATLTRRFGTSLSFDPELGLRARLVEREDTRVPPRGAREQRFVFAGRVERVGYRLDYLRAGERHARIQGLTDATNRVALREGVIASRR